MKDLKDLLDVNRSVADMVDKITALEAILESKLDLIIPILDDCHKRPPKSEYEE